MFTREKPVESSEGTGADGGGEASPCGLVCRHRGSLHVFLDTLVNYRPHSGKVEPD